MQQLLKVLVRRAVYLAPLFLFMVLPARAGTAYTFPGSMPAGCSGNGGNYTCSSLSLSSGDTITIGGSKPATITVTGNFDTSSSSINASGNVSDLSLKVSGTLTLGYQAYIKANITAGVVQDTGGGRVTLGGTLGTTTGAITLAYLTTVGGNVSSTSGAITIGQGGQVSGNVSSTSGSITLSYQAVISGSASTSGAITVGQSALVTGNVSSSGGGAVYLDYQAAVQGDVSTTGAVTVSQSAIIYGKLTGGSGAVSIGYNGEVNGDITTSTGTIDFAQNAIALACARSTSGASITLGYQASVNSVCCSSAASNCSRACVVNNSNNSLPPSCAMSVNALAGYRFDECSSYTGSAGEVKDSVGSAHATAILGATNTATTPLIVNRHADLSYVDGRRYFSVSGGPVMNSDWSVSVWVKFPLSTGGSRYHVLGAMAAGGDLMYMDDLDSLRWGVYTNGGTIVPGTYKLGVLSAGWHHLALVGSGSTTKLYVDGTQKDSVNGRTYGTLAYLGGSYDLDAGTHEGLNAEMDEFLVFSGALDAATISAIYTNQQAGLNYDGSSRSNPCPSGPSKFLISGTGAASTCSAQTLTITAQTAGGATLTSYTGTINLSTSTGKGNWSLGSGPVPSGTLTQAVSNSGQASYQFSAADSGTVKLQLSHTLAQTLTVTVVDSVIGSSSTTSSSIAFSDNAFVFAEDASNKIAGSDVAVAGRPHDYTLSYMRKDPSTGTCGVATDYTGSRSLKFWRTDSGGSFTAPTIVSPALSIPNALPASNNLSLSFSAGVASFNLGSTDIGRYSLNVRDDSLSSASTAINGSSNTLTVRPFTLIIDSISYGATTNPNGSAATDAKFAPAGASFSATVGAYLWNSAMTSNGADPNNTGTASVSASGAALKVGGLAPGFSAAMSLSPVAGSQTPAGGTLGTLSNASVAASAFSGGRATLSSLQYSEVGSFLLAGTGLVSNYLGSGLSLDAIVLNAAGSQNARVGRFVPAGFVLSNGSVSHRSAAGCASPSSFSYLDEGFQLGFQLKAVNAQSATTLNYTGSYARLDLSAASGFQLAGIQGSSLFNASNGRVAASSSSGSWSNGVASAIQLNASVKRASSPDGPFDTAKFGIAPQDPDGVGMLSFDLDTDSPANGNDRSLVATVPLRFGRLRLQNAIGSQTRALSLPLQAQFFDGSNFVTNTLDSCTSVSATQLSFGNFRKSLQSSDAAMQGSSVTLAAGLASLKLAAPAAGRSGSYDVAISLGATSTDASCLQTWTPGKPATTGANRSYLRGAWCSTSWDKDPSARASFGLYRGSDSVIYQRENY